MREYITNKYRAFKSKLSTLKSKVASFFKGLSNLSMYTNGLVYLFMVTTLASAIMLLGYGTYHMIVFEQAFSMVYLAGSSISLFLYGVIRYFMSITKESAE